MYYRPLHFKCLNLSDKFRRNFRKLKFTYVATSGIGHINVTYLFGPVSIKSLKIRSFGEARRARPHSHTSRDVHEM